MPVTNKPGRVGIFTLITAVILYYLLVSIFAVPTAYFLMLFLGNLGLHLSFWAALPGAVVLATLKTQINGAPSNG